MALALAVPAGAQAASLGKLTVLSSLGQPLRAEIELTSVSKEEEGSLVARLASADAFNKANIDFNPVLSSLRFSVEQRQGKQLIRITSTQPLNDPFVDLLLELSGGGSRLMREYTFLLDPPDMHRPQAAQAAPAAPAAPASVAPAANHAASRPAEAAPAVKPVATMSSASANPATPPLDDSDQEPVATLVTKAAPSSIAEEIIRTGRSEQSGLTNAPVPAAVAEKTAPAPVAARAEASNEGTGSVKRGKVNGKTGDNTYHVKEGDTLAEIANRTKDNTVSLDQMLVALYRANPDAFIGDNINRLRAGRVLTVPDAAMAGAVDKGEARSIVVAQAQDFNAYRNKLAGQVASGPSRKADSARQSSGGKVTARVEEKASTSEARDRLQLSKAGAGDRKGAEKASAEEKIAADKAIAEANERVKALEKNVSDLQKLLEIKNKSLAELSAQQKASGKQAAPVAETKPEVNPAEAKPAEAAPAAETARPETPAAPPAAPVPAPAPVTAETPKRTITTGPAAKAGFFERIQDNPFVLPGAGALIALLAGWGFVRVRNKKKAAQAAASDSSEEGEPAEEPESTPAAAIAPPEPAQVEEPVAEAEPEAEAMDPIAEADMYISYGRDEQAEDILRLALKTDPDRQAIRSKLLEIYSKRQDVDSFNDVARELHAATGGVGDEWKQAAAMGIVLDPANALYGGVTDPDEPGDLAQDEPAAATATESQAESEPAAPEEDQGLEFDLDDFKAAEVSPDARPVPDIGSKIDFDLELDNGVDADGEQAASVPANLPKPAEPASPIDLDLPAPAEPPKPADVLEDDESAFAAEMSTKLDLAAAYQEIGDKEGARELLEEVMRGGSDTQIERARDMLSRLS